MIKKFSPFIFLILLVSFLGIDTNASKPNVETDAASLESMFEDEVQFLEVDDAFIISTDLLEDEFIIRWKIAENYYLYKHRFIFSATGVELEEPYIPEGLKKTDEYFGKVEVYYNHIEISIPFKNAESKVELSLGYQGCADAGLCYTPTTRYITYEKQANEMLKQTSKAIIKIPGVASSSNEEANDIDTEVFTDQTQDLSTVLAQGNVFFTLLAFLGAGLLLTFTPCVLPMIPILSGIIAGQGKSITPAKAFRLSFVYVQAMAVTYAVLGVIVARAGSSLSGYLQSPIILWIVASIFVLLALSMFGIFEIKLPTFLENKIQGISEKQRGGNYLGVAFMGIISTLIVSPCTSAPLTAALLFIANSGNQWLGGLSLYFLGVGMGIPLLLIGVSGGRLLPRAGGWMDSVKMLFGFIMIAMALYITSHLIPGSLYLLIWSILLIVAASFFGAFSPTSSGLQMLRKSFAIIVFLLGVIYLVGAVMGNERLLRPLENFTATASLKKASLDFEQFTSLEDLHDILVKAKESGQPVMIDFLAEWCVACYEFEDFTFSDQKVQQFLKSKNVLLLQADVTANSLNDIELLENYNILGLPSILFINAKGKELINMRATGFEDANTFLKRLNRAFN